MQIDVIRTYVCVYVLPYATCFRPKFELFVGAALVKSVFAAATIKNFNKNFAA